MVLCIAIGNSLRGDDGAAHRVLQLLDPRELRLRSVLQLTPELAAEIASAESVLFLDADLSSAQPCVEPIPENACRTPPLAHSMSPPEVVALARRLYGFCGKAFLCRLPAASFEIGEELSRPAEAALRGAAETIQRLTFVLKANGSQRRRASI